MKDAILADLAQIERVHGVKILYAVESGSRVWGFHSANSDYDVRFIYLRPLSWYLSVHERRDVIELPVRGLLDVNGWDLKKALSLLSKSNPPMLEWLASPTVYREEPVVTRLRALAEDYFNARSTTYHYLHMANGNYRGYLRGDDVPYKKYFYVIRPLLCCQWVQTLGGHPPVAFSELLRVSDWNVSTGRQVQELLRRKLAGEELETGPAFGEINAWIEAKLQHFSEIARTTAKGKNVVDDLDDFLLSALYSEIQA